MTTSKARRKAKGRYVVGSDTPRGDVWGYGAWDHIRPMSLEAAQLEQKRCDSKEYPVYVFRLVRVRRGGK